VERTRSSRRSFRIAEILAVGAELTVGDTRDTNSGEIARSLAEAGVAIARIDVLPDRLRVVVGAFRAALRRADLVVSTGGLGPTPDDLTREAMAAVVGETPEVDPGLEAWLHQLWSRRGLPFPEINRKQAWLIPSATPLPNPNGTAPGWWIDRPDGRVAVLLPGPPREMRLMWAEQVLPRLRLRGLGRGLLSRTLRLSGIGESQVADVLGEELLRRTNPEVTTYARADAVDVRIAAVGPASRAPGAPRPGGHTAEELLDETEALVLARLGGYVWARGSTTWPEAIGTELDRLGWSLAIRETGTDGALGSLLGGLPQLRRAESLSDPGRPAGPRAKSRTREPAADFAVEAEARAIASLSGTEIGLALAARPHGDDMAIEIAVALPAGVQRERHVGFLGGAQGRSRAALLASATLLQRLRAIEHAGPAG
jgi:nicotinamide-nucleotide amidase